MSEFPRNSCETASILVALTAEKVYLNRKIRVIKGTQPGKQLMHFWVEVDNQVIDVTAHQFDEYHDALTSNVPSPLAITYSDIEYLTARQAIVAFPALRDHDLDWIASNFITSLNIADGAPANR